MSTFETILLLSPFILAGIGIILSIIISLLEEPYSYVILNDPVPEEIEQIVYNLANENQKSVKVLLEKNKSNTLISQLAVEFSKNGFKLKRNNRKKNYLIFENILLTSLNPGVKNYYQLFVYSAIPAKLSQKLIRKFSYQHSEKIKVFFSDSISADLKSEIITYFSERGYTLRNPEYTSKINVILFSNK